MTDATHSIADLYQKLFLPLTPHPTVNAILELMMSGGETTQDYADFVDQDPEIQKWVHLAAKRSGKAARATSTAHMISLLGMNRVRNMIIGRHIERALLPEDKTILGLMLAEKAKAQKAAAPAKDSKSTSENSPEDTSSDESSEEQEIIPDLLAFNKYLQYAVKAEATAIQLKASNPGQAFAGGVIFDHVAAYFSQISYENYVKDPRLKKPVTFVEELFQDGLRCSIACEEITKIIAIPHQRSVFVSGLLRNIGKAFLLGLDPKQYEAVEKTIAESKEGGGPSLRPSEVEEDAFDLDHSQISALYVGRIPVLSDVELSIDFHHSPRLMRSRNKDLYPITCVIRVAGMLVNLYQQHRTKTPDIGDISDRKITENEAFKVLRLTQEEWLAVKSHYALFLMKMGL